MLDVSHLAKAYGGRTLFADVGLRVQKGDRIGLVGPNGAGKTTLLRIIMGDEHADDGTVAVQRDVKLGYLAQDLERIAVGTVLERVLGGAPEVLAVERELEEVERALTHADADSAHALSQRHVDLQDRYRTLEGYGLRGRAHDILKGLGFSEAQLEAPLKSLSGGWAMRVELARLLVMQPEILLLDEPTNHLDLSSLAWLESFLEAYPGAFLVVSHDRYFLNRMVTSIAELSSDGLFVFEGDYDDYVEARAELEERFLAEQAAKDRRVAELRSFVERFRAKATKARQAQSRLKALTRLEAQGSSVLPPKKATRALKMQLPEPPRSGDTVVTLDRVSKRYGERVVYDGASLTVRRGDKIALIGDNGAGKSTMLKIMAGTLAPDSGSKLLGHNVEPYYFAQHQTEVLDPKKTPLEEMRQLLPLEAESRVRGLLGAFLFSGDAVDKRISVLSGGEKSRLALCKMLAKPTNFLLLDEPTNHLDLSSRDVLEAALAAYPGTVCFISHDRYFIDRLANKVVEVRPGGKLLEYAGDYAYYLWKASQEAPAAAPRGAVEGDKPKSVRAEEREQKKAAERDAKKKQKEAARIESEIQKAEARMHEIDALLCDPTVYADAARCKELMRERQDVEEGLAPLYAQWEQAAG